MVFYLVYRTPDPSWLPGLRHARSLMAVSGAACSELQKPSFPLVYKVFSNFPLGELENHGFLFGLPHAGPLVAARFTARQTPRGRTGGSLQRVAKTVISH